ncbi:MAG TPA: hypothetical protein PLB51_03105 [Candidatus Paceibacterota bacterium]|nr:hypothetical protein [Candidatus Paceibacterota bacterium]
MKKILYSVVGLMIIVLGILFFGGRFFVRPPVVVETPTGASMQCTDESRKAEICTMIYAPVCAKVRVQCIKAPCEPVYETMASICTACVNPLVESYTEGECPLVSQ